MKTCPHCGAELRENARFCPGCMTSLIEKRVIPTPKYALQRWLPVVAAVFVLLAAVGAAWIGHGQQSSPEPDLSSGPSDTTVDAPSPTEENSSESASTLTDSPDRFSTTSTSTDSRDRSSTTSAPVAGSRPGHIFIPYPVTSNQPATTSTSRTRFIPLPTVTTTAKTATSTTKTTSTTIKTTTTTKPYWFDATPASVTEDGLPIEEVTWYYKAANASIVCYGRYSWGITGSHVTYTQTPITKTPISQCVIITGFDAPTSNGIYRIPAMIDGKTVVSINMNKSTTGRHFNDADIAPTVKRIYCPPEMLILSENTINQCTELERLYIAGTEIFMDYRALPQVTAMTNSRRQLYIYSSPLCWPTYCDYTVLLGSSWVMSYIPGEPVYMRYACYSTATNIDQSVYPAFHQSFSEFEKIYGEDSV